MVAGILNAGPPKKKASKYGRALTQPIEAADRTEPIVVSNTANIDSPELHPTICAMHNIYIKQRYDLDI